jgi:Na+/H+-dicarboxylate symporter
MIILAGALLGGIWGVLHVRKRGGTGLDMAQYAAVWALIGGVLGVVATIIVERML